MKSGVVSRLIFPFCFAMTLLSSCSLVVDANRVQCSTTAECTMRGGAFANSVCIDSLCQPDPNKSCASTAECTARGGALASSVCIDSLCQPDPKWKCLGTPVKPPGVTGKFQVDFLVRHLVNQKPLPGVKTRLCRKLDVACSDQLSEQFLTNDAGKVSLSVDAGFEGYARFESASIVPGLYFFNPPVYSDLSGLTISIGDFSVISLLALQAKAQQSADRGLSLISVRDCNGALASGVILRSNVEDNLAVPYYSQAGLPSSEAVQTDEDGYGGLLNAGPGTHSFTATLAATGQRIGTTTLLVQAGALTIGSVVPDGS